LLAGVLLIVVLVACPDGISGAVQRRRRTRRASLATSPALGGARTDDVG
jgi:hypothetical protein